MSKKSAEGNLRQNRQTQKNDGVQVYVEENYFRHVDQLERWRQEYERCQAVEQKISTVSKFSYEPVDYEIQLARIPWQGWPIPDFSYLMEKAIVAVESRFFIPLAIRIGLLLVFIIIFFASANVTALWATGTLVVTVAASLYVTIRERTREIVLTKEQTKDEIEQRSEHERKILEKAKQDHEQKEDERIANIENLLGGNISTIILRIDTTLPKLDLPFALSVDIDIYNNVPLIKVWMPPKSIIPPQTCELLPSGRISYIDKEPRVINKQYIELCCSALIRVVASIYENIPTFDRGYAWVMSKELLNTEGLLFAKIDREQLLTACESSSGLAAIQTIKAQYDCDMSLNMRPIECIKPEEWGDVPLQLLRSLHVKIFK